MEMLVNKNMVWNLMVYFCLVITTADVIAVSGSSSQQQSSKEADPNANSINQFNHELSMPKFAEPIPNVTVSVGRDALLACVVDNLRGFKVAWVRVDTQTILSIHHNVISQNPRLTLSYNDHRSWYLHIRDVHEQDRGWYMCQVNTDPMRSRQGYLQVVVPPSIIDKETSTDMVVREANNATLICKAAGYPEPYVMWRREDGDDINYNGDSVNFIDGEVLHILRVSRLHMGAYLCIASNGVPPSISKRVTLKVQFPPMLTISNQLVGGYIGQDIKLECHTEAFPTSINFWTTEKGDMIVSGEKYEAISTDSGYNKYMSLKIRKLSPQDFGSYKCVAKNSLGETDGFIKLDQIAVPSRPADDIIDEPDDDVKDYNVKSEMGDKIDKSFETMATNNNSSLSSLAARSPHGNYSDWLVLAVCYWVIVSVAAVLFDGNS
ncbi:Hypothetical protein CINCED_3A006511 [Cinara cedri]|uniref:Ig-like domain-containing protein n=1 Tax=Cinara cedri TaxID=506608 RepID=A0A5E4MDA9_9HEMI|nr:Hypothetical protein CINCED_3A006511 [Cinara cedri]